MSLLQYGTKFLIQTLGWAAPILLRKKFTKSVLADLVDFDVLPRHESLCIDLGSTSTFRLSVAITNRSPFDIELDRAKVILHCDGHQIECYILERTIIRSAEKEEFFLRGLIPSEIADAIVSLIPRQQTSLSAIIEFNCSVHNFRKEALHMGGIRADFRNVEWRTDHCSLRQSK